MNRVPLIDPATAAPEVRSTLEHIGRALGATPAMFRAVANSPAALKSMWGSFGALGAGTLGAKLGEQIAVAVAERNGCEYCLAAHHVLGAGAGASAAELAAAQAGESGDARTQAALRFALKLVDARGRVAASDVDALRAAGFDDGQVVEVIAHVALNLFTNYANNALATPVDFPAVALLKRAA
jgi:uncharacterized peroxidase-related enzyme